MDHRNVRFTVDAALLQELGARLVGKPHIALAELIKNSYDADARNVQLTFTGESIIVEDDGHGMSADSFVSHWMRIGTTNKASRIKSPDLERRLTGSKGVGRLAAQLLGSSLTLTSVALRDPTMKGFNQRRSAPVSALHEMVSASVDWDAAIKSQELTEVVVPITQGGVRETFASGSHIGTRVTIEKLSNAWTEEEFRDLAKEIWALRPPFEIEPDDEHAFTIEFVSDFAFVVTKFEKQMNAIFDTWQGNMILSLEDDSPESDVLFEFDATRDYDEDEDEDEDYDEDEDEEEVSGPKQSGDTESTSALEPDPEPGGVTKLLRIDLSLRGANESARTQLIRIPNCPIDSMHANIKIFNLRNRQPRGITVSTAREYMRAFGGVHIYDDDFRLPYYGPQDWLDLERDHARRLSRSALLPENLRVSKGLHDLPSRRNVFGTTTISTAHEKQTAADRGVRDSAVLANQVSRDRLADNVSFGALRNIVRLSMDLYATEVARTKAQQSFATRTDPRPPPRPTDDLQAVRAAIGAVETALPAAQYRSIVDHIDAAEAGVKREIRRSDSQAALLGTLATVGMTTLAWEHEATKQRLVVLDAAHELRATATLPEDELRAAVQSQANRLLEASRSMNDVSRLFRPVLDRESRENRTSLLARRFIQRLSDQLRVLGRGADVRVAEIPKDLRLPPGTYSGWVAVLQNLIVNAFNAVLEEPERQVVIDGGRDSRQCWIRIQDTGTGVDLQLAEEYFKPFVRGYDSDPRRAELGLGGSGLGLTIVRMITDTLGVTVRFTEPDVGFSTSVVVSWRE